MNKFIYIAIAILLFSCKSEPEKALPEVNWTKEDSRRLGKNIAIQEELDIKLFLEMHKDWEMTRTGSGLQYYIYEHGEGEVPLAGDIAEIEYAITLLDGTACYKTEADEYEELVMDKSEVESGVQEALRIMKVGDKAKLIIPSHIGHGLIGDLDKIPGLTILVVDITLLGIKK